MKQKLLLKTMLLLCALVVGSSSVWAADPKVTFDFSSNTSWQFPTSSSTTDKSYSDGSNSIAIHAATGYYWGESIFLLIGKSGSTITLPTFSFNVSKIAVTFSGSTSEKVTLNFYVGTDAVSTELKAVKNATKDFEILAAKQAAGNVYVLKITNANNAQIKKIEVYEAADIAAPTISPNGSDDISATHSCEVTLNCTDGDATIYYTTDGSDPKTSDTKTIYSGPFTVSGFETVVKAVSKKGDDFSNVTSAIFKDPTIQPLNFTISLNNAFFGTSYTGSNAKGSGSHSNTAYGTTVTFDSGGNSNNYYISDSEIRAYAGNTLTLDAPDGYAFTKMTFASSWNSTIAIEGGGSLNSGRTIWTNTNGSSSVSYAPGGKSDITTIAIELTANVPITPAKAMTTFCTTCPLNFTGSELKAYAVSSVGTAAVLEEVTDIPVGTGLILVGTKDTQYEIPVGSATTLDKTNKLVGVMAATEISKNTASNEYDYVLSDGKFVRSANGTLPAGKAYLPASAVAGAPSLDIVFDGDNGSDNTTGINSIENGQMTIDNSEIYNLNGQRVAQPTKGMYIVNGKKVVIK